MAQRDRRRKPLAACAVVGSKRHQYRKRRQQRRNAGNWRLPSDPLAGLWTPPARLPAKAEGQ